MRFCKLPALFQRIIEDETMSHARLRKWAAFTLGILSSWLFVSDIHPGAISEAGCPPIWNPGWAANSIVTTSISGFTSSELNRVNSALALWDDHNGDSTTNGFNCSKVNFGIGLPTEYRIQTNNGVLAGAEWVPALTGASWTSVVNSALTTIYWGAYYQEGVNISPVWNRNNSAQYFIFVSKVMLHEAGHTMGLDDGAAGAGNSVMNPYNGTNDSGNSIAIVPQPCDDDTNRHYSAVC
jgi:hypothetical protein